MARLTELGKSGEWTYAGDVSPNQLCEKLAYYENLEEMSQKKKNQVTKVIKIGSCFDCPLSDVVDHGEVEGKELNEYVQNKGDGPQLKQLR